MSGTNTSIGCLLDEVQITSEKDIEKGDLCRFGSIEEYVHKHPIGSARVFNVICSNEHSKQYLGLGLSDSGVTQDEIEQMLFNEYNSEPIEREIIQPSIWKKIFSQSLLCDENKSKSYVDSLKFHQISWDEFHQRPSRDCKYGTPVKGKLDLIVYRLNSKRVQKLINASLTDIHKVFNSFKKR